MKIFRKILKNKLFYLVLLLGVFLTPIFNFTLQAQEVYDNGFNLASPDLEGKEYLGEGFYRLYNNDVTLDYNVYNGIYAINGTFISDTGINISTDIFEVETTYTASIHKISGTTYQSNRPLIYLGPSATSQNFIEYNSNNKVLVATGSYFKFYLGVNGTYNNLLFKLQIEKGDTATPYKLPIQALQQHVQLRSDSAFNEGYGEGYNTGYVDGEFDGYQYGYEVGVIDGYDDGFGEGYNQGQGDYGYYDVETDQWLTAVERGLEMYDRGYQDGTDDTNAYYNDNGLFIPQLTPKAHLIVDFGRYDDPYFYLQNFSGQYDSEYFSFQHTRWLDIAFDWAYSVESDFLAINDVYRIKYKNDTISYKYFFYRYDTDSVYFYSDDGTLIKIVERADFDYSVYEEPELPLEVQDRIDNAYNNGYNNARSTYAYYDSQSEEYLTATEYGEIQYNLGVISIRDKAYLDGFHTGMMDSHKYGFDWVRGTYYELIDQRPILGNLRDETSFTYQLAHTQGFNEARGRYGFWNGRVWVTAEFIREDSYTDGYNSGFRDGTNELYNDIYDEIYDIGYRDGQRIGANNKFYTGLEKWLVPAIIVVLFFGLLMLFPRSKED